MVSVVTSSIVVVAIATAAAATFVRVAVVKKVVVRRNATGPLVLVAEAPVGIGRRHSHEGDDEGQPYNLGRLANGAAVSPAAAVLDQSPRLIADVE